jgi:hypothetical protein
MLAARPYAAGGRGVHVFGAEAQADDSGGDAAENGEALEESEWEWETGDWCFEGESWADEAFMGEDLESLGHAGGESAAILNFVEMGVECVELKIATVEFAEICVGHSGRLELR